MRVRVVMELRNLIRLAWCDGREIWELLFRLYTHQTQLVVLCYVCYKFECSLQWYGDSCDQLCDLVQSTPSRGALI